MHHGCWCMESTLLCILAVHFAISIIPELVLRENMRFFLSCTYGPPNTYKWNYNSSNLGYMWLYIIMIPYKITVGWALTLIFTWLPGTPKTWINSARIGEMEHVQDLPLHLMVNMKVSVSLKPSERWVLLAVEMHISPAQVDIWIPDLSLETCSLIRVPWFQIPLDRNFVHFSLRICFV